MGEYEKLRKLTTKGRNDKNIPIEIYDEDGYYLPLIETLKIMELKKFNDDSVYNLFNVSHNIEEFREHIDNYLYSEKENAK